MRPEPPRARDFEGVLVSTGWGATGEVASVGLMTFDEQEYAVDMSTVDRNWLQAHLTKHVRIRGRVRSDRVLEVDQLRILGQGEEP